MKNKISTTLENNSTGIFAAFCMINLRIAHIRIAHCQNEIINIKIKKFMSFLWMIASRIYGASESVQSFLRQSVTYRYREFFIFCGIGAIIKKKL